MANSKVTLVSPKEQPTDKPNDYFMLLSELSQHLDFKIEVTSGLSDLLVSIFDPLRRPDLILIDVDVFNTHKKSSVCEIINAIATVIDISEIGKMPSLAVMHNYSVNADVMNELHKTKINGYVVDNYYEATSAIKLLLSGNVPDKKEQHNKNNTENNDPLFTKLTTRQRQVMKLVCRRGLSNKAIGKMLNIGESTVKIHMSAILKVYCVKNRTQLALAFNDNKSTTGV